MNGNPAYTVVQVATNDLIILIAFVPMVKFLLGVSKVSMPYSTLFVSAVENAKGILGLFCKENHDNFKIVLDLELTPRCIVQM